MRQTMIWRFIQKLAQENGCAAMTRIESLHAAVVRREQVLQAELGGPYQIRNEINELRGAMLAL